MKREENILIAEWTDIPWYENCYVINKDGVVKNLERPVAGHNGFKVKKEKICKPFLRNGYLSVALSKNGKAKQFTVHRLLGILFLPNPQNKPTINHINGIKTDNRVENLEWCTQGDNNIHALQSGLRVMAKYGDSACAKRVYKYNSSGEYLEEYESITAAALTHQIDRNAISNCCRGTVKSSAGFIWKYYKHETIQPLKISKIKSNFLNKISATPPNQ